MAEKNGIYKCEICGNIVSVIEAKAGELVCCGQPMTLLEEKTSDEGKEKHVPVVEITEDGVIVKVGSVPHPMEEKHYIKLIQLMKDGEVFMSRTLYPHEDPKAEFCCVDAEGITARILCNIHGVWKN